MDYQQQIDFYGKGSDKQNKQHVAHDDFDDDEMDIDMA